MKSHGARYTQKHVTWSTENKSLYYILDEQDMHWSAQINHHRAHCKGLDTSNLPESRISVTSLDAGVETTQMLLVEAAQALLKI